MRAFAAAVLLCACSEQAAKAPPEVLAPAPSPQGAPLRSAPECLGPLEGPGARVRLRERKGELRIGVVAGLKDADEANVASLRKLVADLARRGADVLIADGDLGDNSDEQGILLGALAESGLPVLAVAGNREVRGELDAAEADLRRKGARIVDLSHTRVVELGDATVVGLPGAFERRQLHRDGACIYVHKDIDALFSALDRLPQPVLLVAAVPPRGKDKSALDFSEGQNLGDPRLLTLLRKAPFGIFAQVWESGGRAIDGDGRPLRPAVESDRLYLNPGAADRTPWPMSDGTTASGLAALLIVHGRKALWERLAVTATSQ